MIPRRKKSALDPAEVSFCKLWQDPKVLDNSWGFEGWSFSNHQNGGKNGGFGCLGENHLFFPLSLKKPQQSSTPRIVSSLFCLSFLQHLLHCHGQVAWACLCTISSEGVKGGIPKGLLGLWWISCAKRQKSDEVFRKKTKNFLKLFGGHSDENHVKCIL